MSRLPQVGLVLVLLLTGASMAGCIATDALSGDEGDGCESLHPMWVAWEHPEAWARLRADGQHGPWTVRTHAPESALTFQDDGLDERVGPGNYSLQSVSWVVPEARQAHEQGEGPDAGDAGDAGDDEGLTIWGPGWGEFRLDRRLSVTATLPVEMPVDRVREHAATFLSEVSAATADQQEAWIETFLADREVVPIYPAKASGEPPERGHRFHVDIHGPLATDALVAPVNLDAVTEEMLVGSFRIEEGAWTFGVQLTTRIAELPRGLGPVRDVQVDPLGNVMANVWKTPPDAAVLERVLDQTTHFLGIGALEEAVGKPIVHRDCQDRFAPLTRTL